MERAEVGDWLIGVLSGEAGEQEVVLGALHLAGVWAQRRSRTDRLGVHREDVTSHLSGSFATI